MSSTPEDIKNIDLRIEKMKHSQNNEMSSKSNKNSEFSLGFRIVSEFIIAIFIGISVGYILDTIFKTNFVLTL